MARSKGGTAKFTDLIETMRGFQESRVLLTAVELDLFTAVGEGSTAAAAAAKLATDPRATEALLNALVALGALSKQNGVFRNTSETSRFLVASSPQCARPGLMHTVHLWRTWSTLTECIRAGTAVIQPGVEGQQERWTRAFIAAMHQRAIGNAGELVRAIGLDGVGRMLDVGGGSGAYAIAFAKASETLRADVFDLPSVVPLAQEYIREAGVADRVATRTGDMRRDDLGSGYDLALLSAICHMFSPEENLELFRRCYRALAPGGRLAIRDFIVDPSRTSPLFAVLFALNMLVGTKAGSTYTEEEYQRWLADAGFTRVGRPSPSGDLGDLIVATRD